VKQINQLKADLSDQQKEAFDLAIAWFNDPDSPFVLRGYAGTGKTFCAQRIIKALQPNGKVAICAPTHKAVHVLRRMAQEYDLKDVYIATLHSLLHIMPGEYDALGRQKLKANEWSKEPWFHEFALVVIDEASMVDSELMVLIEEQEVPTLFMGDPAQLPPINETESPVFQIPAGYELTQVMRYEGAIAQWVTALRQDLGSQFPPRLKTEGNITKSQKEEWESRLILAFTTADPEDPFAVRSLAWTNQRASVINNMLRQSIMGVGEEEPFVKGERLVAKEPIFLSQGDEYINSDGVRVRISDPKRKFIFMQSCAECTVKEVRVGTAGFARERFYCYYLDIESDLETQTTLTCIHPDSWNYAKEFVRKWKSDILEMPARDRKSEWANFYGFLEKFNLVAGRALMSRLQYAYCQTIHQSQGGTFKEVFLDLPSVFGCRDVKLRNQLVYVGGSRASEHLYVFSKF
jgi:exodeoxyribonuclease-5